MELLLCFSNLPTKFNYLLPPTQCLQKLAATLIYLYIWYCSRPLKVFY